MCIRSEYDRIFAHGFNLEIGRCASIGQCASIGRYTLFRNGTLLYPIRKRQYCVLRKLHICSKIVPVFKAVRIQTSVVLTEQASSYRSNEPRIKRLFAYCNGWLITCFTNGSHYYTIYYIAICDSARLKIATVGNDRLEIVTGSVGKRTPLNYILQYVIVHDGQIATTDNNRP